MRARRILCCLPVAIFCVGSLAAAEVETRLQAKIDRAAELNVTAPRAESQAILEAIIPMLERATPEQRARVNLLRARNQGLAGDYQGGLELVEQVLAGRPTAWQRLRALELGANLAVNEGRFEAAFDYLRRGLDLAPEVGDPGMTSGILSLASYFHSQAGELDKALEYGRRSVRIVQATDLVRDQCVALQRFALAQQRAQLYTEAEQTYRRGLVACAAAEDPVFVAATQIGLGELLRRLGRLNEAQKWLVKGTENMQATGFTDGMLNARLYLAQLRFDQGDLFAAKDLLVELQRRLAESELWKDLAHARRLLAEIAKQEGDEAQALAYYEAYMAADEKFLNRERAMRLAYLGVAFDTQRRKQQLALLKEKNQVLALQKQARDRQRMLYIGGAVSFAIIGLLLLLLLLRSHADQRRFRRLSESDALTGLYNHTQFLWMSDEALAQTREAGHGFVLIIADIDLFKRINDEYGHTLGDEVLRMVSARLREVFGKDGIVGRLGGEEFGIALPGMRIASARLLIDRFQARLANMRAEDKEIRVTISFGLARAEAAESLNHLRQRADQAMYRAKRGGRDRTEVAAGSGGGVLPQGA